MTATIQILGMAALDAQPEIPGPLDELIYRACSAALADAGTAITDVDAVCMAASDVLDGRGISTMTLTGATGSFRKSELRICNDGLAAVGMAASELLSGVHERVLVCAWSKLSDADLNAIVPLAMEPAFHRPLGMHPGVIHQLRESVTSGSVTMTRERDRIPADTAAALVLSLGEAPGRPRIRGFGSSMGDYLGATDSVTVAIEAAVDRALRMAGADRSEVDRVHVGGAGQLDDDRVLAALDLDGRPVRRSPRRDMEVGYAAGLLALTGAVADDGSGDTVLVVSANGLGLQSANAVLMEV